MIYPLSGVTDGDILVVSRGETEEQVIDYIKQSDIFFRGVTIWLVDRLPLDAAKQYSLNHSHGWLYRCPLYLERQ
jgi:hypothetical protein